jgi:hypothetical protein
LSDFDAIGFLRRELMLGGFCRFGDYKATASLEYWAGSMGTLALNLHLAWPGIKRGPYVRIALARTPRGPR